MFYVLENHHKLNTPKAYEILNEAFAPQFKSNLKQQASLFQPEGGSSFLFYCNFDGDDSFEADSYRWRSKGSHASKLDDKDVDSKPKIFVRYFYIITEPEDKNLSKQATFSSKFKRYIFSLKPELIKNDPIIVHYIGDKSFATNFAHGNSHSATKTYLTTLKSARNDVKAKLNVTSSPKLTYMTLSGSKEHSRHGMYLFYDNSNFYI